MGMRRVKIKGRRRDSRRVTLKLIVERWKSKRKVMFGSSGEKWEIGKWCVRWCDSTGA